MTNITENLVEELRSFDRLHKRTLDKAVGETGVYRAQHRMLMFIGRHSGISQKELSDILGISTAAVTTSVKALERDGYVKRTPIDCRTNSVSLTEKGEAVVRDSVFIFERIDKSIFEGFSESEEKMLLFFLAKMKENLIKLNAPKEENR